MAKRDVALTWQWQKPENAPAFKEFGFEIERDDDSIALVPKQAFTDSNLSMGKHHYRVRARGWNKEKGVKIVHLSKWTEPEGADIASSCAQAPVIALQVLRTQAVYATPSDVRFHLTGQITLQPGCTLKSANYHVDAGTGFVHTAPLTPDAKGHFDTFVNALGEGDEVAGDASTFTVTVSAEDEAGPATSDAFVIETHLKNPYAPDNAVQ